MLKDGKVGVLDGGLRLTLVKENPEKSPLTWLVCVRYNAFCRKVALLKDFDENDKEFVNEVVGVVQLASKSCISKDIKRDVWNAISLFNTEYSYLKSFLSPVEYEKKLNDYLKEMKWLRSVGQLKSGSDRLIRKITKNIILVNCNYKIL